MTGCRFREGVWEGNLPARFWAKVDKTAGCWDWTGARHSGGYGSFRFGGKTRYSHRLSYEMSNGPVPTGLQLDHLCRNRQCVNPAHLEAVTQGENLRRGKVLITHCPAGHAYDEANTQYNRLGWRRCAACHREQERQR